MPRRRPSVLRNAAALNDSEPRREIELGGDAYRVDLAQPANQWVRTRENSVHHLQVVDSKRLKIGPKPSIEPGWILSSRQSWELTKQFGV
jgi:hypothetical protein